MYAFESPTAPKTSLLVSKILYTSGPVRWGSLIPRVLVTLSSEGDLTSSEKN